MTRGELRFRGVVVPSRRVLPSSAWPASASAVPLSPAASAVPLSPAASAVPLPPATSSEPSSQTLSSSSSQRPLRRGNVEPVKKTLLSSGITSACPTTQCYVYGLVDFSCMLYLFTSLLFLLLILHGYSSHTAYCPDSVYTCSSSLNLMTNFSGESSPSE